MLMLSQIRLIEMTKECHHITPIYSTFKAVNKDYTPLHVALTRPKPSLHEVQVMDPSMLHAAQSPGHAKINKFHI